MKTRAFAKTKSQVSEVGIGCWQFGGDWGDVSDDQCKETLAAAVDAGVTFIDTADVYGAGRSESIIGEFQKGRREDLFIATKLGRLEGYPDQYSLDLLRRCTQNSLKRLQRDVIDLTQLHCIPPDYLRSGEVFDWLRTLQQEGLIRQWGVSVEAMDEALVCLEQDDLASLQIIFNVFRQKPIDVLFEKAKQQGVSLIVRLPLASGLLAGKYTKQTTFDASDHRNYNRDGQMFNAGETFAGLPFEKGVELTEQLRPMLMDHAAQSADRPAGVTMAQMAQRWILDHDAVTTVITGANKPQQAKDNAATSDLAPLTDEQHAAIRAFYSKSVASHIRGVY